MVVADATRPRIELRRAIGGTGEPAWRVGRAAGLSPTVLSHIMSGRRPVTQEEARRLADVLETEVHALFPDMDEDSASP